MARPLRIQFPGALYHVISRGNQRAPASCSTGPTGKSDWIGFDERWKLTVGAARLRPDGKSRTPVRRDAGGEPRGRHAIPQRQLHQLLQSPAPPLRPLVPGAVPWPPDRRRWPLPGSKQVHPPESASARLVDRPDRWPWSSYPGYRASRCALPWVTYGRVLGEFGHDMTSARRAYAAFVAAGMREKAASPFAQAMGGLLVGSAGFVERISGLLAGRPAGQGVAAIGEVAAAPVAGGDLCRGMRILGGRRACGVRVPAATMPAAPWRHTWHGRRFGYTRVRRGGGVGVPQPRQRAQRLASRGECRLDRFLGNPLHAAR